MTVLEGETSCNDSWWFSEELMRVRFRNRLDLGSDLSVTLGRRHFGEVGSAVHLS